MLGWSQGQLAEKSQVAKKTIADFERDATTPQSRTLSTLRDTLEGAGIVFIAENGGGVGVRLKARTACTTTRLDAPAHENQWDVIAHHEAGHAVIGRVLKLSCGYATIVPDEDSAGHAITADPHETATRWDALGRWRELDVVYRARIIAIMAGAEAEIEFFGECAGGDGDDRWQIDLMLDSLLPAGADVPAYAARLRRFTRTLVQRHRDKIKAVADALQANGHLSEDQLDAMVGSRTAQDAGA